MVTTTLKIPDATRSISSSICCSVEEGELRSAYVECGWDGVEGPATAFGAVGDAAFGGGRSENKDGDGAMKDKY